MKYYTIDVEEKGISFDIPCFEIDDTDELFNYDNKKIMFESIVNSAVMMESQELDSVPCFIINGAICDIDRKGIFENLQKAIEFYSEEEMYETCSEINDLRLRLCLR